MRPRPKPRELPVKKERVNEGIRIAQIQLIDHTGKNHGVVSTEFAKQLALEAGLDLVEINPNQKPPVCKIMDYGKFKYQQSKKTSDSKKKQHQIKLKEVRLTPKTEENDLETKIKNIRKFLVHGDKVQVSLRFKGREIVHKDRGYDQMKRIADAVADISKMEGRIELQGKQMVTTFSPDKRAIEMIIKKSGGSLPHPTDDDEPIDDADDAIEGDESDDDQ